MSDELRRQLSAARYAFHKVTVKRYADAVRAGFMCEGEAHHHYALAMLNYDGIIKKAVSGSTQEANEADMEKGFRINDG